MSLNELPDGSVVLTASDEPPGDGPFETIQLVTRHKLDTRTSRYYVNGKRVGRDVFKAIERAK